MDACKWGGLRCGRCLGMLLLVCLCLVKQHFHYARAEAYPELIENQNLPENADSRNKFDSLSHLLPSSSEQDSEYKRSSAFFPLRGKKMSLDPADMDAHYRFLLEQENEEGKRSQFYPLRGKKVPDDLKRASYFMPMRGRKDGETWMEGDSREEEDSLDKRMSSFMPMRGKKRTAETFQLLGKPGTYPGDLLYPSSSGSNTVKRAGPAFLPVRGKKSPKDASLAKDRSTERQNDNSTSHARDKRSVSFVPMRGRRTPDSPGEISTSFVDKKKYTFTPMRGRRQVEGQDNGSFSNVLNDDTLLQNTPISSDSNIPHSYLPLALILGEIADSYKRASSFMPMRGRRDIFRNPGETLASMINKRLSSFMPMRGRRNFAQEMDNSGEIDSELDKRSSSFMPMRGRRSKDDQMVLNTIPHDAMAESSPSESRVGDTSSADQPEKTVFPSFMPMDNLSEEKYDLEISDTGDKRGSYFMPMRGRRGFLDLDDSSYFHNPYLLQAGIGSSFMTRHYNGRAYPITNLRSAVQRSRKFDWDSVKRAFHATRGKRDGQTFHNGPYMDTADQESSEDNGSDISQENSCRCKRSILRSRASMKPQRQYIALKRPMSFFATRGKRMDDSSIDTDSKLN